MSLTIRLSAGAATFGIQDGAGSHHALRDRVQLPPDRLPLSSLLHRYPVRMCIVEIRPGRGGQDAERFVGALAGSVRAWAVRQSRKATLSDSTRAVTVTIPGLPASALTSRVSRRPTRGR